MIVMRNSFRVLVLVMLVLLGACNQEQDTRTGFQTTETVLEPPRSEFVRNIPDPVGYVNDFENTFSPAQKQELENMLSQIEKETTIEVAVVTLDSTMSTKQEFDYNTLWIGNHWGVGKRGDNNGILVGVSRSLRIVRVHYGAAIEERISNDEAKQIIDEVMIPHFRSNDFYQGTRAGIEALVSRMK